jgi:exopolysaccharide biosynthesis polyprenyl glycosylphosphotransferase
MNPINKKEALVLFIGDVVAFYAALWLMLLVRYDTIPSSASLYLHVPPFSILFLVWIVVFFIAGLYEKHTLILKSKIGNIILRAQITNSILAFLFFYFIPFFGITPKTNLFIYLVISFGLISFWRLTLFPLFEKGEKENAILIGNGEEMRELEREVNHNPRYAIKFISSIDLNTMKSLDFKEEILNRIYAENVHLIAADFKNEKVETLLPSLYNLIFSKVRFIDMHKVYEDIFDRIPLSLVKESWFLQNISGSAQKGYDFLKRGMDLILATLLGIVSLVIYPFVYVAIKLEDGGPVFFVQERIGKNNKVIRIRKFRSLAVHHSPDGVAQDPKTTKVGKFIRKTRIDELPQLWNVFRGDLSMIGPRPEIPTLAMQYEKEIPFYNVRYLIKPGLAGWAQLYGEHGHGALAIDETRNKLSYDLYYIKNRSFMLDLKIALRTIKTLLSREGV